MKKALYKVTEEFILNYGISSVIDKQDFEIKDVIVFKTSNDVFNKTYTVQVSDEIVNNFYTVCKKDEKEEYFAEIQRLNPDKTLVIQMQGYNGYDFVNDFLTLRIVSIH